ncbi:hypothetical protein G9A89_013342 [Geosiphon pyriformis]|nr:hypothetical protein G9A89_013342 [Geosiphon pyriformis]
MPRNRNFPQAPRRSLRLQRKRVRSNGFLNPAAEIIVIDSDTDDSDSLPLANSSERPFYCTLASSAENPQQLILMNLADLQQNSGQTITNREIGINDMEVDSLEISSESKPPISPNLRVTIPEESVVEAASQDSEATPTSADWGSDLYAETISSDSDIATFENSCYWIKQQQHQHLHHNHNHHLHHHNHQQKKKRIGPALINYAVTQQQGWETLGRRSKRAAKSTHPVIEDAFNVPRSVNEQIHLPSQTQYNIFVLADGHGGAKAAEHFCHIVPDNVREVLNSEPSWDFRDFKDQHLFRNKIRDMLKALDHEFLASQKRKFSEWVAIGQPEPTLADEGSTLIIVVLFDGVAIVSNIGDSKTILCKTQQTHISKNTKIKLDLIYQSTDQSPGHPQKAYHIYKNGGVFRREENEKLIKTKVLQPSPNYSHSLTSTSFSSGKTYPSLQRARVARPPGYTNSYGLPEDQSVNIGDTMGDLYFKLDPPLFPCEPDVEFVILESGVEYLGIMAPDGLWDHLMVKMPEFLRKVAKYLGDLMYQEMDYQLTTSPSGTSGTSSSVSSASDSEEENCTSTPRALIHQSASSSMLVENLTTSPDTLRELAVSLCDRLEDPMRIFAKDQGRYDDCTVIAFSVKFEDA